MVTTKDAGMRNRRGEGTTRLTLILGVAVVAVLAAAAGALAVGGFGDVEEGDTHADAIEWLLGAGVTEGCEPGQYCPDEPVTRAQMASFLQRLAGQDPDVDPSVDAATVLGNTPEELAGEPGPTGPAGPPGPAGADGQAVDRGSPTANVGTTFDLDAGRRASITVGADGHPLLAHYGDDGILVTRCDDAGCTSASTSVIDSDGNPRHAAIAIGADGLPVVSYTIRENTDDELRVAHCSDPSCSDVTVTELDDVGSGIRSSIVIGADGLPIVSYQAPGNDLAVQSCANTTCTSADKHVIDNVGAVGRDSVIVLGVDGMPIIAHANNDDDAILVTRCTERDCAVADTQQVATDGRRPKIRIGGDGLPVVSYRAASDTESYLLRCTSPDCSGTDPEVEIADPAGHMPDLLIGTDGLPMLAYGTSSTGLNVSYCHDASCESHTVIEVEDREVSSSIAHDVTMTLGTNGHPVIAYIENVEDDLRITTCGSRTCTPHFRSR